MTTEQFTGLLLFLGAIVAAVLFVVDRQGKRLSDSIPPEILPVLIGLLALAETLAKTTPTTADDDLIKQIKAALNTPPTDTSTPQTPEELAARLNPTAAQG